MTVTVNAPPSGHTASTGAVDWASELDPRQTEALARLVEAAHGVHRRHQFFLWSQGALDTLLPHQLLVCGAYQRQRRAVGFHVFQSVVLSAELLGWLSDGNGALLRAASQAWVVGRSRPLWLEAPQLADEARVQALRLHAESGIAALLVHGVARPQRPGEIESLFLVGSTARLGGADTARRLLHAELLMPYLHSVWRRVQAAEIEISLGTTEPDLAARPPRSAAAPHAAALTGRELQILLSARDGKSNQQIGDALGISPLTVKNHIQKILRKLGAHNRAHAVALAMAQEQLALPERSCPPR